MKREEIEEMNKQELIEYLKMITDRMSPLYVEFKYEKEMINIVEQLPQTKDDLVDYCHEVTYAFENYTELLQIICTRLYELTEIENSKQKKALPLIIDYELWSPEDDENDEFEDDGLPF